MKNIFISATILINSFSSNAQNNTTIWQAIDEKQISITGKREIIPEKFKTFRLDLNMLQQILLNSPLDKNTPVQYSTVIISLPIADGSMQRFKISESPVMEEPLQISFPKIRTYNVRGIDDSYASGKLDLTEFGFHGMIKSPNGDVYIDPYCKWNTNDYITYYTADFIKPLADRLPEINVIEENHIASLLNAASPSGITCVGANLKTYRLAVACTYQYAAAATGTATPTLAQTLAKVVTTVNRVDGVYETELAVKLMLVPTTTLVLYTSAADTAFTLADNGNSFALYNKSQTVITAKIGTPNFDIGHTFSTGGGGLAGLGVVCNAASKAKGITGNTNPVGDSYDIDYVAHEIGHQFAGNHTFNGSTGSCSAGNRNASTAVEPGSGVTIMAYAGICAPQNLQGNSIAYFHSTSYNEITNFIYAGGGNSCDVLTATGNNPPTVNAGASYVVPISTPFSLTGWATDIDGDALTYQWEEFDVGATAGNWNKGTTPFFRSYAPVITPTRYFPKLSAILAGTYTTVIGEYLPTNTQILKFRLTARDNKMGGGGVCSATTQVSVNSTAGPFAVTSQSVNGITYNSGSVQTVNWNVNGTNVTPINCANVNIYLSTDLGNTFTLLLANTPNDGTEDITLPIVATNMPLCRVKVESIGNIFFDINKKNFTISTTITSIKQLSNTNNLNIAIYPNPFSGSVKIDIPSSQNLDVNNTILYIYDLLGNIVKRDTIILTENFSKTYDLSNLANGSYIVEVTDGKQKSMARLIKL